MCVPADALTMNKLERMMNGNNEFVKTFLREMADLPTEAWEQIAVLVNHLHAAGHPQA